MAVHAQRNDLSIFRRALSFTSQPGTCAPERRFAALAFPALLVNEVAEAAAAHRELFWRVHLYVGSFACMLS